MFIFQNWIGGLKLRNSYAKILFSSMNVDQKYRVKNNSQTSEPVIFNHYGNLFIEKRILTVSNIGKICEIQTNLVDIVKQILLPFKNYYIYIDLFILISLVFDLN